MSTLSHMYRCVSAPHFQSTEAITWGDIRTQSGDVSGSMLVDGKIMARQVDFEELKDA